MRGHKGGGSDDFFETDEVIEFTPPPGFNIHKAAKELSEMMLDERMNLMMLLPHVNVEFEAGCTRQEIIDGYNLAMGRKPKSKHSNCNNSPK